MSNNDPTVDPRGNPNPVSTEFLSKTAHHEGKDGSAEQDPPPPAAQQSPRFSQASQDSDDTERDHAPPSAPAPAPVSPSSSRGLSPDHESTITDDLRDELEPFDWEELEARFYAKMEECTREEERIGEEFREWVEVCVLSASLLDVGIMFSLIPCHFSCSKSGVQQQCSVMEVSELENGMSHVVGFFLLFIPRCRSCRA